MIAIKNSKGNEGECREMKEKWQIMGRRGRKNMEKYDLYLALS